MRRAVRAGLLAVPAVLGLCRTATSDWPQLRGPDGRAQQAGTTALPERLDARTRLWRVELPAGHSSPCVTGTRVFVTAYTQTELEVHCLATETGARLWSRSIACERHPAAHEINGPASPSPATDGERVFVIFPGAGLFAYSLEGEPLWQRPLPAPANRFGAAASPIVADDSLVLLHDSDEVSFLEALNPVDGTPHWRVERDGFAAGWSTPALHRTASRTEILVCGVWWLTAYDLATGAQLWALPGLSDEPITMPASNSEWVFATSYNMRTSPEALGLPTFERLLADLDVDADRTIDAEEAEANESVLSRFDADGEGDHPLRLFFEFLDANEDGEIDESEWRKLPAWLESFEHANATLAIRPGQGDVEPKIVWQHARGVPECPSPLLVGERLYTVKNGGLVTCLEARTGDVLYEGRSGARGPVYASPVAGAGKVYVSSARGVVTVLRDADTLQIVSQNDFEERILATPALSGGKVFVRTERSLSAFSELFSRRATHETTDD